MHDRISDFDAQDPGVRQIGVQDFVAGAANTTAQSLDSNEIPIRVLLGESGEISAVPAAQVHFDGGCARKNFGKWKWTKIICGNKFNDRGSARNPAVSSHLFR